MSNFSPSFVGRMGMGYQASPVKCIGRVFSHITGELADSEDGFIADIDNFAMFGVELDDNVELWTVEPYRYGDQQLKAVVASTAKIDKATREAKIKRLTAFYAQHEYVGEVSPFDLPQFAE